MGFLEILSYSQVAPDRSITRTTSPIITAFTTIFAIRGRIPNAPFNGRQVVFYAYWLVNYFSAGIKSSLGVSASEDFDSSLASEFSPVISA